jgi:PKD repeat protein
MNWFNQTLTIAEQTPYDDGLPSVLQGGAMAFDPTLNQVILWTGCNLGACPTAQTWVYDGLGWQNLTGTFLSTPSPRFFAAMDFDPVLNAVVLVGGFNVSGAAQNDTWTYSAAGWTNITATVGFTPQNVGGGGLVWDPALNGLAYVDGCQVDDCVASVSYISVLNGTWSDYGWGPGVPGYTYLGYGALVWDPVDAYLVWFGGYDYYAGTSNYTYTYTPALGWTNITDTDGGCFIFVCSLEPAARYWPAMTWDAQVGAVLLTGGQNNSCSCLYNDTWEFLGGVWFPQDLLSPAPPAGFLPGANIVLAANSTGIPAFLLGGFCGSSDCTYNEWVWEIPPTPYVSSATFNPVDNGTNTTLTTTFVAPSGGGPIVYWSMSWGDASPPTYYSVTQSTQTAYDVNFTHAYVAPGIYNAVVTEDDFFYVIGTNSSYNVTVNPDLGGSFSESKGTVDSGQSVTFTGTAVNGTPAYAYSWNFGDGSPAGSGATTTHTFSVSGTHTVTMTLTDAGGGRVTQTMSVTVNPALVASVTASSTTPNTGVAVNFTGGGTGGTGTYTYAWRFGDGGSSSIQNPSHPYATAGTYTVTLWVNDTLGGSSSKSITVTASTPSSPAKPSSSSGGFGGLTTIIIIVVVVLVVIGLLAALLMRRKGSGGSSAPPPPPTAGTYSPPPPGPGGPPPGAV